MLQRVLEFVAPDECIMCKKEGACICLDCSYISLVSKKPACPICNSLNNSGKSCRNCRAKTQLRGATIPYRYRGAAKELIGQMKYTGQRSVARYFGANLPPVLDKSDFIVSYVPSDGSSRRRRGFDQARLIAKTYARKNNYDFAELLLRQKHIRQVGKTRKDRLANVAGNFIAKKNLNRKNILLVDDVITTGATASECAKVLKLAGAKSVWLVAVAKG